MKKLNESRCILRTNTGDIWQVESGHTLEEYRKLFGWDYDEGDLYDFSEKDVKDGSVEADDGRVYWKIIVDGEPRYFETNRFEEWNERECKEELGEPKEKIDEGTSNFRTPDNFPLLVFYTYDEFYYNMEHDSDYPDIDNFENEDGDIDYDAYDEAVEEFEQKYWDNNKVCVLDEDEQERLENRLYEFNEESKRIAIDADVDADGYQSYGNNLNLEDIELNIESGYYSGAYINVEHEDLFESLDEEFKKQQIERFNKFFEELKKEFHLTELGVAWGPASNGEVGYNIINESLKEKKESISLTLTYEVGSNFVERCNEINDAESGETMSEQIGTYEDGCYVYFDAFDQDDGGYCQYVLYDKKGYELGFTDPLNDDEVIDEFELDDNHKLIVKVRGVEESLKEKINVFTKMKTKGGRTVSIKDNDSFIGSKPWIEFEGIKIYPNDLGLKNIKGNKELIDAIKSGKVDEIIELRQESLKESKEDKLNEGHQGFKYKGYDIDWNEDELNLEDGMPNGLSIVIKDYNGKDVAEVSSYKEARKWIDEHPSNIGKLLANTFMEDALASGDLDGSEFEHIKGTSRVVYYGAYNYVDEDYLLECTENFNDDGSVDEHVVTKGDHEETQYNSIEELLKDNWGLTLFIKNQQELIKHFDLILNGMDISDKDVALANDVYEAIMSSGELDDYSVDIFDSEIIIDNTANGGDAEMHYIFNDDGTIDADVYYDGAAEDSDKHYANIKDFYDNSKIVDYLTITYDMKFPKFTALFKQFVEESLEKKEVCPECGKEVCECNKLQESPENAGARVTYLLDGEEIIKEQGHCALVKKGNRYIIKYAPGYYVSEIKASNDEEAINKFLGLDESIQKLAERKSKRKLRYGITTGDPAKNAAFFNHAMGSDVGDANIEASCVSLGEEKSLDSLKAKVKSAYDGGDMFQTYDAFEAIDKVKAEKIANKAIKESKWAKEIGIKSLEDLWSSFEDGGNEDADDVLLEVIHALDDAFETHIYDDIDESKKVCESQDDYYVVSDGKNPKHSYVFSEKGRDAAIGMLKDYTGNGYWEVLHYVNGNPTMIYNTKDGAIEEK